MRAAYINSHASEGDIGTTFVITSMPILDRKAIKARMKEQAGMLPNFDDIAYENAREPYNAMRQFIREEGMRARIVHIGKFSLRHEQQIMAELIRMELMAAMGEPIRAYIPWHKDKTTLKRLRAMLAASGMDVSVDVREAREEEEQFLQLSGLIAGCSAYYRKDALFMMAMEGNDDAAKAQLASYLYGAKKGEDKMNLAPYELVDTMQPKKEKKGT